MPVTKQLPLSVWLQSHANDAVGEWKDTLQSMAEYAEELEGALATALKQRDNAVHRIQELVGDLDTHREFWRRSSDAVEEHKTTASRAENRAKTMQKRLAHRRKEDGHNAAAAQALHGWLHSPLTQDSRVGAEAKLDALFDALLGAKVWVRT